MATHHLDSAGIRGTWASGGFKFKLYEKKNFFQRIHYNYRKMTNSRLMLRFLPELTVITILLILTGYINFINIDRYSSCFVSIINQELAFRSKEEMVEKFPGAL